MLSNGSTHWIPDKEDPSLTSTKAKVFCFLTVLTHPLIATSSSVGAASLVFTLFRILGVEDTGVSVLIAKRVKAGDPTMVPCLVDNDDDVREDPVKAATERIGFARLAVAQMAAIRQVLAMILLPVFVMGRFEIVYREAEKEAIK
jgi:hypothetical protein